MKERKKRFSVTCASLTQPIQVPGFVSIMMQIYSFQERDDSSQLQKVHKNEGECETKCTHTSARAARLRADTSGTGVHSREAVVRSGHSAEVLAVPPGGP